MIAAPLGAEPLRLAFWHTELSRKGPGLLLRDILKGEDQVVAVVDGLRQVQADVVVLAGIDWDHDGITLSALADTVRARDGPDYPFLIAPRPNTGIDTGLDLDGDGRLGGPGDAQGYGRFAGEGALAILSRYPVAMSADHSERLWRDMPDSLLIDAQGREGAAAIGGAVQRLSTVAHAEITVDHPHGPLTLMIFHATPPVFDGPEDRNGRRNHDEVLFWKHRLDGAFGPALDQRLAIIGAANLPPQGGDGRNQAIQTLLTDPRLRDPPGLRGKPTVDWPDPGPGKLRVDYILPSRDLKVIDAGLTADPKASRHSLIWVDLEAHAAKAPRASPGI